MRLRSELMSVTVRKGKKKSIFSRCKDLLVSKHDGASVTARSTGTVKCRVRPICKTLQAKEVNQRLHSFLIET